MTITIDQQIADVVRELKMRRRVYPRWVSEGRMTQAAADHQIAAMEAVKVTLETARETMPGAQKSML